MMKEREKIYEWVNENKESGKFSFFQFMKPWENCRRHNRRDDVSCGHGLILLLSVLRLCILILARAELINFKYSFDNVESKRI